MKIQILYRAQYSYAEAVSFSPHLFRLFPRAERHVRILSSSFRTNADAVVNYRRDLFDNDIASCFYPEQSTQLQAKLDLELDVEERNAFGFLVDSHALDLPFVYQPMELRVLSPYLQDARRIDLPFWTAPTRARAMIETLMELIEAIHTHLEYERREEGEPHSPAELLRRGAGSCRDFAVLLAEVLRGMGIATRLASGYLCEFGDSDKIAEGRVARLDGSLYSGGRLARHGPDQRHVLQPPSPHRRRGTDARRYLAGARQLFQQTAHPFANERIAPDHSPSLRASNKMISEKHSPRRTRRILLPMQKSDYHGEHGDSRWQPRVPCVPRGECF